MNKFIAGVQELYDKRLLENRVTVEGNVIGTIYKNPLVLNDYKFKTTDFITQDGLFYYSVAKKLKNAGYTVFDEVTVLSTLQGDILNAFQERGSYSTIQNIVDVINERNSETYIDNLYRSNILLSLYKDGFNLFNKVEWDGKQIVPFELFNKMRSFEITDWYESMLCRYSISNDTSVLEEEIVDFTDEFIDECEEGMNNGISFEEAGKDINGEPISVYPFLSRQISGLTRKTLSMIAGFSSAGKSTWLIGLIISLLEQGEKIILISNEEEIKKYKVKLMVWLLAKRNKYYGLTKKKFLAGEITEEDRKQLKDVQKYWKEKYKNRLKLVTINDSDFSIAKKKIRESAIMDGYTTFIVDTFKIQAADMANARTDLALVRDSRELQKLAAQYNMIGIASVQLAEAMRGSLFLSASSLSNSKQLKEICENLFLMRNVYNNQEFDPKSKYYCKPFKLVKRDNMWCEEPYEPDPTAVWRMLFVEKCRGGINSNDNGQCYVLKFNGNTSTFSERCIARPAHTRIE